jgi:hypothetical protein
VEEYDNEVELFLTVYGFRNHRYVYCKPFRTYDTLKLSCFQYEKQIPLKYEKVSKKVELER